MAVKLTTEQETFLLEKINTGRQQILSGEFFTEEEMDEEIDFWE
jgi:predicted transcriptional regulator